MPVLRGGPEHSAEPRLPVGVFGGSARSAEVVRGALAVGRRPTSVAFANHTGAALLTARSSFSALVRSDWPRHGIVGLLSLLRTPVFESAWHLSRLPALFLAASTLLVRHEKLLQHFYPL